MAEDRGLVTKKDSGKTFRADKNYLFVIGIDKYEHCRPLSNARRDAETIVEVLTGKYQFDPENVIALFDEEANEDNIYGGFKYLAQNITPKDTLVIYYSGHGHYDKVLENGYWLPMEARPEKEADYIPNSTITDYIKAIKSHHTLLVSDSCFSGTLFVGTRDAFSTSVETSPSRWGLTSGRNEPVSDGPAGSNSPFARYFTKFLSENTEPKLPVSSLVQNVKIAVGNNSPQKPMGSRLFGVGDEGGEFVFHLRGAELEDDINRESKLEIPPSKSTQPKFGSPWEKKKKLSWFQRRRWEILNIILTPIITHALVLEFISSRESYWGDHGLAISLILTGAIIAMLVRFIYVRKTSPEVSKSIIIRQLLYSLAFFALAGGLWFCIVSIPGFLIWFRKFPMQFDFDF